MTQVIPQTPPDYDRTRIIERPSGFFWQSKADEREYGPFATLLESVLAEAEGGIAEYLDPETGEPAEEERPRLEEH